MDSLNRSEASIISSAHEVRNSSKDVEVPVHNIPTAKETDICTRLTCSSKSDLSSFLGDVQILNLLKLM